MRWKHARLAGNRKSDDVRPLHPATISLPHRLVVDLRGVHFGPSASSLPIFLIPETSRDEIEFDGLGAARRRLDMFHLAEMRLDAREKIAGRAALKNLADERPARFQGAFGHVERRFKQCNRTQMIRGAMAGG